MANLNEFKKIENEFQDSLKEVSGLKVNHELSSKFKTSFFEENIFSKNLKEINTCFLKIKKDEIIEISGTGIVNILVEKDSNLAINLNEKTSTLIRVIVEKGVKLNLCEISNNKDVFKNLQIYLNENSKLNFANLVFESRININKVYQKSNSIYKLNLGYKTDNSENFIRCETMHLESGTISEQNINGSSMNGSRVICDGLINVNKGAENSHAKLNLKGLILDKTSKIISEPILEVNNNNVSCSHGCSISQISGEIEFYMESRGIEKEDVIKLMTQGHFNLARNLIESNEIIKLVDKLLE